MSQEIEVYDAGVLVMAGREIIPPIVAAAGAKASNRFYEFFTANIRNPNTRRAYFRTATEFLTWCQTQGISDLGGIKPVVVAAYIEFLQTDRSKSTVKQALAAIRMLFDWLVEGQVVLSNPATSVRGPKHVIKKGKTPVLSAGEVRTTRLYDRRGDEISLDEVERIMI